jgi:hypothetical protein
MTMRERIRHMLPGLLNAMALWTWLGQVIVAVPDFADQEPERAEPAGPPPGHPERLSDRPMTPEERALWANLEGTDR